MASVTLHTYIAFRSKRKIWSFEFDRARHYWFYSLYVDQNPLEKEAV